MRLGMVPGFHDWRSVAMVTLSALVSGLDAELVRLGYKGSTMVWYRGCWRRLENGPFPVWWTHGLAARFNREKKEWARHAVALPRSTRQKRLPLSLTTIGR